MGWGYRWERTLRWLCWVFIWECDFELEQTAFPYRLLFSWDTTFPPLQVHHAVGAAHGLCEEAEGMISSP